MTAFDERNTCDNANVTTTTHTLAGAGTHTLRFTASDPRVIVQRLVVTSAPLPYSYLGPPESRRVLSEPRLYQQIAADPGYRR